MTNIKYIGNDTKKSKKGKIHVRNGNYTICGKKNYDNPKDWISTNEVITCQKRL